MHSESMILLLWNIFSSLFRVFKALTPCSYSLEGVWSSFSAHFKVLLNIKLCFFPRLNNYFSLLCRGETTTTNNIMIVLSLQWNLGKGCWCHNFHHLISPTLKEDIMPNVNNLIKFLLKPFAKGFFLILKIIFPPLKKYQQI
jgi:hypothetical protein